MADESRLVHLTTCGDSSEAGALRALLEAEGIPCVVQGEQHHAMLGSIYGGLIELRVLIPEAALERARELLAAWESGGEEEEEAAPEELEAGAPRCADHGSPPVGTCLRCGAFVCEACVGGATEELLCPSCEARAAKAETPQHRTRRTFATTLLVWMVVPILMALLFGSWIAIGR